MKIIYQNWVVDDLNDRCKFVLRGRIGFEVKQVVLDFDYWAVRTQEGREVAERDAYNKLRQEFGQDAEKPL